jgi:hypothetical protein
MHDLGELPSFVSKRGHSQIKNIVFSHVKFSCLSSASVSDTQASQEQLNVLVSFANQREISRKLLKCF